MRKKGTIDTCKRFDQGKWSYVSVVSFPSAELLVIYCACELLIMKAVQALQVAVQALQVAVQALKVAV